MEALQNNSSILPYHWLHEICLPKRVPHHSWSGLIPLATITLPICFFNENHWFFEVFEIFRTHIFSNYYFFFPEMGNQQLSHSEILYINSLRPFVCLWQRFWGVGEGRSRWSNRWPVVTSVSLWQDVILPSHYGFFAVVTRFATSQFEQELSDISSHHIMFWKQNFRNINSIKSFLIFPAGSLFSRFLRIAIVIRTRTFWYFQPSHYVLKTKFSRHQFHQELSDISSRQFVFKIS